MGVSLIINHENLCEEIEIILTKMQLGLLNSYIINCADENRGDYAEELRKDINKYRNHLNKFKKVVIL